MEDMLTAMTGLDKVFLACAVFGGIAFLIRMALLFVGGDTDADVDVDIDTGIDVGDAEFALEETGASFRVITLQGLTGFFMMFGLVGLTISKGGQGTANQLLSVGGATVAGLFTLWVIAKMFQMMKNLQSSGTIDIRNAIGQEGTVYLNIPAEGTGKARVAVQDRLRVLDAVSEHGEAIETGARIEVVKVVSGNMLVVKKL